MGNPLQTKAWDVLKELALQPVSVSETDQRQLTMDGISLDLRYSFIDSDMWQALFDLAKEQDVFGWRDRMVAMERINITESRSVGHMALRSGERDDVQSVLSSMQVFVDKTHADNKFTDVVHIGIGGSDLGPRMVCQAIRHLPRKMAVHFVSNVDGADIEETLKPLDPKTTLFVIASKTFTTQETMMNANYAKTWLGDYPVADHMIALSTNKEAVSAFGINTTNMFPFWDWVGGRFSVWSAIGMPIALAYGWNAFQEFLNGAKSMDDHFKTAPIDENIPVNLALFGIWNRNFLKRPSLAILPYAQNLNRLVDFLQQLDMESNGKSVDRDGHVVKKYETGPVIFGQVGTNGQHAFHQWLHQGTDIVPCEFICMKETPYDKAHHRVLNANAQAQSCALAQGEDNDDKARFYEGDRPSVTIMVKDTSPYHVGQLIALYEHKVFVQGIIWNINSFDQFGVELGKVLAKQILAK